MLYVEYLGAALTFWRKQTVKNEPILDPMLTVIKLAALGFQPIGTKIWMRDVGFDFDPPAAFQGVFRKFGAQGHEDLRVFGETIERAVVQYKDVKGEENKAIKVIFENAVRGLEMLQATYPNSNTSEAAKNWIHLLSGQVNAPHNIAISQISNQVREGWEAHDLKRFARWFEEANAYFKLRATSQEASSQLQSTEAKIKTLMVLKQIEFEEILHKNSKG